MTRRDRAVDWLIGGGVGAFAAVLLYASISTWVDQREFAEAMEAAPAPATHAAPKQYGTTVGMTCTWYGSHYEGRRTASGSTFNAESLTCATVDPIPFGTVLQVAYKGRLVEVTVTDRMPLDPTRPENRVDLSAGAFRALSPLAAGRIRVQVRKGLP